MKKNIYTSPRIFSIQLDGEDSLLVGASPDTVTKQWQPKGGNTPTIDIIEEDDNNLGGADSEISGAKGNKFSWDTWD